MAILSDRIRDFQFSRIVFSTILNGLALCRRGITQIFLYLPSHVSLT